MSWITVVCTDRGHHPERTRGWLRGTPSNRHTFYFKPWSAAKDADRRAPHPALGEAPARYSRSVNDGLRVQCVSCPRDCWLNARRLRQLLEAAPQQIDLSHLPFC